MRTRISEAWSSIVGGFWFLPGVMALSSILLAIGTLWLDATFDIEWDSGRGLIYAGGVAGGRDVLATIAGGMITVTGVVFSITIVTLSLASNQYGPRLLRNFMRDRANQLVLGTFISTFTYCLVVLRSLRDGETTVILPSISITVGVFLALVSMGVLIYFIHHISDSIQASSILSGVGRELDATVERIYPERIGHEPDDVNEQPSAPPGPAYGHPPQAVASPDAGYIRAINPDGLLTLAREHDVVIRMEYGPGAFVFHDMCIATVWSGDQVEDDLVKGILGNIIIGRQRTQFQDLDYLLSQLVQPALLSLSSGVNNSFVAITAIDWMGATMAKLAARQEPSNRRRDDDGTLRIITASITFSTFVDAAFNPLRESARSNTLVTLHLLDTILALTNHVSTEPQRETLRRHAELIDHDSQDGIANEYDRSRVQSRVREIMRALASEKVAIEGEA